MGTPAMCVQCLDEDTYPSRRGMAIADHVCRKCGALGTLTRAGRNPSARAREAWLKAQPAPDGRPCVACGDTDHQAFECHRTITPLRASELARPASAKLTLVSVEAEGPPEAIGALIGAVAKAALAPTQWYVVKYGGARGPVGHVVTDYSAEATVCGLSCRTRGFLPIEPLPGWGQPTRVLGPGQRVCGDCQGAP